MTDSQLQMFVVAIAIHLAGAGIALYLWTEHRDQRFLQFWALAWGWGVLRWLIHFPAQSSRPLLAIESIIVSVTMFFMVLGSYDVLPSRPWTQRRVVVATALILLAYGWTANAVGQPVEMGYGLFVTVLAFVGACMALAYHATQLSGYAIAAATCLYQMGVVGILLLDRGRDIANEIVVPLYNIPLMLSIVVIAHQRDRRQLRQLYGRLARVEDDERRALHAELHDQVGANLSALRLEIDVAANLLSRNDGPGAERHLGGAREAATETIAMTRDLMADLRPPALDDYGLVAALRTFAESHSTRLSLPIDVAGEDLTPRPGRLVESSLFRIAHEAVINAARHASATRVTIRVAARDGRVILTVEDDGAGFDRASPGTRPDHWGLRSMHERARSVGGALHVKTAPGAGTRIMADVPLGTG